MIAETLADVSARMDRAVEAAKEDFATVRTGHANPQLFQKLMVDYYGSPTPLAQLPSLAAHPQVAGDADWAGELPDFNFYCSPARLRIRFSPTEDLELLLHHTDTMRQTERGRGLNQQPRAFVGSIEIPEPTFVRLDSLPPKSQQFIQLYLDGRRHTSVRLSGVEDRISVTSFGWEFERP